MFSLTPKARTLINKAIRMSENPQYTRVWSAWTNSHPEIESIGRDAFPQLTIEAAYIVHAVLREMIDWLDHEIQRAERSEDTLADMDNDLSFIEAIDADLTRDLASVRHL
jgi:hypothetical protein